MTHLLPFSRSVTRARPGTALALATVFVLAACESSGPRTGKLSVVVGGLPSATAAKVTLKGPNGFTKSLTGTEVVASLESRRELMSSLT